MMPVTMPDHRSFPANPLANTPVPPAPHAGDPGQSRTAHWQAIRAGLDAELGGPFTLDALTGPRHTPDAADDLLDDSGSPAGWMIVQRRRGHRHSIDDVLTAWFALRHQQDVTRHLDLGTGIGTVGLLVLWGLGPSATIVGVEAQEISFRLWHANLTGNNLLDRVHAIAGDLRDLNLGETFRLVTGSPPYFPPGTGVLPDDPQKAHARFELRGDVRDYAITAKRHLAPDGVFVFCFPYPQKHRALDAARDAGLAVVAILDVIPRATLPPLFSLFACRHAESVPEPGHTTTDTLTVRHENGRLTAAMATVRRGFGFNDSPAHGGHSG